MNSLNESTTHNDANTASREEGGHLQYLLTAYLLDNISDAGRKEVEQHLTACSECQAELGELAATLDLVEGALCPSAAGDDYSFEERRRQRVLDASRPRRGLSWVRQHAVALGSVAAVLVVAFGLVVMFGTSMQSRSVASRGGFGAGVPNADMTVDSAYGGVEYYEEAEEADGAASIMDGYDDTVAADPAAARPRDFALAEPPVLANNRDAKQLPPQTGSVENKVRRAGGRGKADTAYQNFTPPAQGPAKPQSLWVEKQEALASADKSPGATGAQGADGLGWEARTARASEARTAGEIQRRLVDSPDMSIEGMGALTDRIKVVEKAAAPSEESAASGEQYSAGVQLRTPARAEPNAPPRAEAEKRRAPAEHSRKGANRNVFGSASETASRPQATEERNAGQIDTEAGIPRTDDRQAQNAPRPRDVTASDSSRYANDAEDADEDMPETIPFYGRDTRQQAQAQAFDDGRYRQGKDRAGGGKSGALDAGNANGQASAEIARSDLGGIIERSKQMQAAVEILESAPESRAKKNRESDRNAKFADEAKILADMEVDEDGARFQAATEVIRGNKLLTEPGLREDQLGERLTQLEGVTRHAELDQLQEQQKEIAGLMAQQLTDGKFTKKQIKNLEGYLGGQQWGEDSGVQLYKNPSLGTTLNIQDLPDADLHVMSIVPQQTLNDWGIVLQQPGNESDYHSAPIGGAPGRGRAGSGGGSIPSDGIQVDGDIPSFAWQAQQLGQDPIAGFAITENRKRGFVVADPIIEKNLRAFSYYRALDPQLSRDSFAARALRIPAPVVGDEGLGQERFRARYGVNPYVDTRRDHESTFAMDVDTASYTRARALLRAHQLPDPKTVRTEEFVNAFQETLPSDPDNAFSVYCEGGPSPFGESVELLKITAKARELLPNERRPAILTFAVDSSGSMFLEDRLEQVKQALETLLDSLHEEDRVALVAYGAQAYLALPHTSARDRERIIGALGSLRPAGSTNVEAGLELAYRIADESFQEKALNRVVLCSDGVATSGSRTADAILEKVKVFARRGIYISAVGFGKQRYNDAFMERIANEGNGNYAFVDSPQGAEEIFRHNLPSMLQVLARDAKIQVVFDQEVVSHYRLLGYENRDIADADFRNDKIDAGEVGPGTTVTALYEIRRRPGAHGALGRVHIRFHHAATSRVEELDFPLSPGVLATSLEETTDRFRFIACVAELAELLRESYWARNGSYAEIIEVLAGIGPEYRHRPEIREVTELVLFAQKLTIPRLAAP